MRQVGIGKASASESLLTCRCVPNVEGSVDVGSASGNGAVQEMKDCRPFGVALRMGGFKPPHAAEAVTRSW
jgi:hypothetical protein